MICWCDKWQRCSLLKLMRFYFLDCSWYLWIFVVIFLLLNVDGKIITWFNIVNNGLRAFSILNRHCSEIFA